MEALERTHELLPDLMILDIMMPKMDAIKRLMADTSLLFIPVFLVTAKADGKDMIAGLEGGDDDTLGASSLDAVDQGTARYRPSAKWLEEQATALAVWHKTLQGRVTAQLGEIERISRLKQFLAPQVSQRRLFLRAARRFSIFTRATSLCCSAICGALTASPKWPRRRCNRGSHHLSRYRREIRA